MNQLKTTAGLFYKSIVGILININDTKGFKEYMYMEDFDEENKTDIRIILDGVTKDFSLESFKQRLGF